MRYLYLRTLGILGLFFATSGAEAAFPLPWQVGFQEAATPIMEKITTMHNLLLVIITGIAIVVSCLLIYTIFRFRASRNPTPSNVSHNTLLEIVWTLIPVCILIVIGIPSLRLLFFADRSVDADMAIEVTGHQWYWSYKYPGKNIEFDSYMIEDKDLKPGQLRLLDVDNRVIVPVNTTIKVLVTSADVLHSFAVPAFGIKKDAVPGRINETWINIKKEGVYYGQCSELCGSKHGFMPIAIEAVSADAYQAWLKSKNS
jgi:cytochrome c oxidase subunit 2